MHLFIATTLSYSELNWATLGYSEYNPTVEIQISASTTILVSEITLTLTANDTYMRKSIISKSDYKLLVSVFQ